MDEQTIQLIRDMLAGASATAGPLWDSAVAYTRWWGVAQAVIWPIAMAVLAYHCTRFAKNLREDDSSEVNIVGFSITGIALLVGLIMGIVEGPAIVGSIVSPEGYLVNQFLTQHGR